MKNIFIKCTKKALKPTINVFVILTGGVFALPLIFNTNFGLSIKLSVILSIGFFVVLYFSFILVIYIRELVRLIEELQKKEEKAISSHSDSEGLYKFLKNERKTTLVLNQDTLLFDEYSTWHVSIEALKDNISFIRQQFSMADKYFVDLNRMRITDVTSNSENNISLQEDIRTKDRFRWYVCLSKAINKGETIDFEIKYVIPNKLFICSDDLALASKNGIISRMNDNVEYISRVVSMPCDVFDSEIQFPASYHLPFNPQLDVQKRHIQLTAEKEKCEKSLKYYKEQKRVSFLIENPLVDCSYRVEWRLPSVNDLLATGYITKDQHSFIVNRNNFDNL